MVFESMFSNTEQIAGAVAAGLGESVDVQVIEVTDCQLNRIPSWRGQHTEKMATFDTKIERMHYLRSAFGCAQPAVEEGEYLRHHKPGWTVQRNVQDQRRHQRSVPLFNRGREAAPARFLLPTEDHRGQQGRLQVLGGSREASAPPLQWCR